ncbi:HEAT repeat domain-containing protein [Haliscomenobacter hydrossis]|uniref:peptidylprolyl isomerase n=1 Tax=Haliscomenobacter hydrossis (strain ATCC 27775 / DSM 1100 / LMG 10767 / O) TaxID=760192 RepID=F4KYS8_HALH1|nr:HEAT repeat domain-containing protein [Haliscomenobacter hydrossis]AEE51470.1 peptidyl-prolyl cis-trans isomerase cyclophilin type [Haliscomenobacter hydrossis DSM 1100]
MKFYTRIGIFAIIGFCIWGLTSCVPPSEKKASSVVRTNIFADATAQDIYQLQDLRNTDSLLFFLRDADPSYRYAAAMAFASIKDTTIVEQLGELLKDESPDVRYAVAYALGQTKAKAAEPLLIAGFDRFDSTGISMKVNAAILEAIGKCGSKKALQQMSTVSTYKPGDSILVEGLAWGIYRFALRGITDTTATKRMVEMLGNPQFSQQIRYVAAYFLARANVQLDTFASFLAPLAPKEKNPFIRMALASSLGKTTKPYAADTLIRWLPKEPDYRVRVNIVQALGKLDYKRTRVSIFNALRDPNAHVASTAARTLVTYGQGRDATFYWKLAKDSSLTWSVQASLYAAAQRLLPPLYADYRETMNFQCRRRYERSASPEERAAFLEALSEFPWNYRYIQQQATSVKSPVVRSAAWNGLKKIASRPDFERFFGLGWRKVGKELSIYFRQALQGGDAGVMAIAAEALRFPQRNFGQYFPQVGFLDTVLTSLKLPRDLETYGEIQKTRSFLKGEVEPAPLKTDPKKHPINWEILASLRERPVAIINTSKGTIRIQLLPEVAPGAVAMFVAQARKGYYNGKSFHRVVPNFVAQGGCPRGDGSGSLDFTLRTEVPAPMRYDHEGMVGLASAGLDTESVQFFITHSPAPHLDGNYTIFATVADGMSVVHDLQIGDVINKISIQ